MSDFLKKTAQFKADLKADQLKNPDLPEMDISNYQAQIAFLSRVENWRNFGWLRP